MLGRALDLDEGAHRGGRAGEDAVDDVGELGIVAGGSAEEEPERGAVALDEVEVGGEALFDARAARLDAAGCFDEHREQSPTDVFEHRDEERSLRRKVLVEDGLRDSGGLREVVHRRGVEAALGELDARDIEELTASFVGREAYGSRSSSGGHPPALDFSGIS